MNSLNTTANISNPVFIIALASTSIPSNASAYITISDKNLTSYQNQTTCNYASTLTLEMTPSTLGNITRDVIDGPLTVNYTLSNNKNCTDANYTFMSMTCNSSSCPSWASASVNGSQLSISISPTVEETLPLVVNMSMAYFPSKISE